MLMSFLRSEWGGGWGFEKGRSGMLVLADVAKVEVHFMEGTVLRAPRMGEAGKTLKLHSQASPKLPSFLLYVSSLAQKQDL